MPRNGKALANEGTLIVRHLRPFLSEPMKIVDCNAGAGALYFAFLDEDPSAVGLEIATVEFSNLERNVKAMKKRSAMVNNTDCANFLSKVRPGTFNVIFFDPDETADGELVIGGKTKDFTTFVASIGEKNLSALTVIKTSPQWEPAKVQKKLKKKIITTIPIKRQNYVSYHIHIIHE